MAEKSGGSPPKGGGGGRSRSAITGRFVTHETARRHPSTTVTERAPPRPTPPEKPSR